MKCCRPIFIIKHQCIQIHRCILKPHPHLRTFFTQHCSEHCFEHLFWKLHPHLRTLFWTFFWGPSKAVKFQFTKLMLNLQHNHSGKGREYVGKKCSEHFLSLNLNLPKRMFWTFFCVQNTKKMFKTMFKTVFCENVLRCGWGLIVDSK